MTTFDRHLLREWLGILLIVIVAMVGLLLVDICYNDLRSMLEAGAKIGQVLQYLAATLPSFFAIILPLAILISLLYALTKLHRANELTAMRCAGVSLTRITLPIWAVGVAACAVVWWLNSTLVPRAVERSRQIESDLEYRREARTLPLDWVGAVTDVAFDEPLASRMWFMNRFSQETQKAYGVSVVELDSERRPTTQILANEGWVDSAKGGGWTFRDGREIDFSPDSGEAVQNAPFRSRYVPGYREDPQLMLLTDKRPIDLSFFELHRVMGYFQIENPARAVPFAVRYYSLIADTLGPLVVIAIAIPFAVTGVRTNPAVGVSKSIGLFFLYYVLTTAASALAAKGWIDPKTAAALPILGMAAVAGWFLLRMW